MSKRVIVNPVLCVGHGICAELLPERVQLDEWGYPVVSARPVTGRAEHHARRAVASCPALALALDVSAEAPRFSEQARSPGG